MLKVRLFLFYADLDLRNFACRQRSSHRKLCPCVTHGGAHVSRLAADNECFRAVHLLRHLFYTLLCCCVDSVFSTCSFFFSATDGGVVVNPVRYRLLCVCFVLRPSNRSQLAPRRTHPVIEQERSYTAVICVVFQGRSRCVGLYLGSVF